MKKIILATITLFAFQSPLFAKPPAETLNFESRGAKLKRQLVKAELGIVWSFTFLSDSEVLMAIKSGKLQILNTKDGSIKQVTGLPVIAVHGQGGLMEVVLSPQFKTDKLIYITYAKETAKGQYTTALGSGQLNGNALSNFKEIFVATPSSGKGEHFGGRVAIEPNGETIWLAVGERGDRNNSQNLGNHLGKILRLTKDGKPHPENPYVGQPEKKAEIYSYGHRNPQGLFIHPETKELWVQEHGPRGGDEINAVKKGLNYGWPKATYGAEYWGPRIGQKKVDGTEQPIHHWTPSIAPCGFVVYNSGLIPQWKGLVFSGALVLTHLNVLEMKNNKTVKEDRLFADDELRVRSVGVSPMGELFYGTDEGHLFKIAPGS